MKTISQADIDKLVQRSKILFGYTEHPSLLLTPENEIVKFFYRRKRISTSIILPQARRFHTNSRHLARLGIKAPIVKDIFYAQDVPLHIVTYQHIEGVDYRELCNREGVDCLAALPVFISRLHSSGVYFRAIHLGNIVRCHSDDDAIVDISDLSIRPTRLSVFLRARNLAHLIDTDEDKGLFYRYGLERFLNAYFLASGFSKWRCRLFMFRFNFAMRSSAEKYH